MTDLTTHRREFPGLEGKYYFNFGGQGVLPDAGLAAIIDAYKFLQEYGPFSGRVNEWVNRVSELLRGDMARVLGCPPESLSITEDVTVGCNIALWGIDWRPDDHILLTDSEHPGIIAAVNEIARRFRLRVSFCPLLEAISRGEVVETIARHLQPNTRVLLVSHVLWNTGDVLPLREISRLCHDNNISDRPVWVVVDAAQSVGCLPLNLTELEADFYAFTGHKWWCGPAGVGGLYVRPEIFNDFHPTFIGWRGIDVDAVGRPAGFKKDGRRFEVATSSYPNYEGLRASLGVIESWEDGVRRYDRIRGLAEYLWKGLKGIEGIEPVKNSPPESGLVSFFVNGSPGPNKLVKELEGRGFLLRTLLDPLCVRACVHYFTTTGEVDRLLDEIKKLV